MSRLFIRVQTVSGSRIIISQDMTARDASEVRHSLITQGLVVSETDATPVNMKEVLKRRDRTRAKSIPKPLPVVSNVTPIRKKKPNIILRGPRKS